ncbi:MAG: RNase adapter RapZ [Desulfobulbaceae bacterium]|nr:RNase adapter RapZ [Desulfobulbaceae bacterium]MCK5322768.1 RNase adapter RapZ [Desulfobulbaceae bacterium]MCK5436482.1 RNase adapter RapZ [Desulfobulbaceae bacterium]
MIDVPSRKVESHNNTQAVIITGLSGAGKHTVLKVFEDIGYYCVDNLPLFLLSDLLDNKSGRLAFVMDARDESFLSSFDKVFPEISGKACEFGILFLEADESALIRRFSQARRPHPMASPGTLREAMARERGMLSALRKKADRIIDTSLLSPHELRNKIIKYYSPEQGRGRLRISLVSFGFKHGLPADADMVFDVRFLPNPYFEGELKHGTGLEPRVASFVLENDHAATFMNQLGEMLAFLIPQYREEGKVYLTICVGCTGGKHRSVALVEKLSSILREIGENASVSHRDIGRE